MKSIVKYVTHVGTKNNFYINKFIGNLCGCFPYNLTINQRTNIRDRREEIAVEETGTFVVFCDVETAAI